MLSLQQVATMDRFRLEDHCKRLAQPVYLGGHRALCRMLGRYKVYVDTTDQGFGSNLLLDGFWEMWLTQFMARFVEPGMTVVDVGANYGYYSVLLADLVGPEGLLHAVEPNPVAGRFLRDTLSLNGFDRRTTIHHLAAGADDTAQATLAVAATEPKNAHLIQGGDAVSDEFALHSVAVRRLDSLLAGTERLDFIKIDAEGAEQDIFAGMQDCIGRWHPAIVMEFNAGRYADPRGFLEQIVAPYGRLSHIDYGGHAEALSPERVLTERPGEDWLLFLNR